MTNSKPKGMSQNVHSCSKTCHTPLVTCRNIGQNAHTEENYWECLTWWQMTAVLPKHLSVNIQGSNMKKWHLVHKKDRESQRPWRQMSPPESMSDRDETGMRKQETCRQETELESVPKPPCPCKRPYFQIRWGFPLSSGLHPPPRAGLRGTLD